MFWFRLRASPATVGTHPRQRGGVERSSGSFVNCANTTESASVKSILVSGHQRTTRDGCGVHSNETPSFATTTRRTRDRIATRAHRCVVHGGWARDGRVRPRSGRRMAPGPPVFAFVLGQTGLAVVLTPASPALLAVGEVALLGLLFSDVAVPAPVPAWSLAVLLGGVVGGAAVLALPTSIPTGCDSYSDRYRGSLIFSSSIRVGDRDWENGSTHEFT